MTQLAERNGQEQAEAQQARPPAAEYTAEELRRLAVLAAFGTREAFTALEALAEQVPVLEQAVTQAKLGVTLAEEGVDLREAELAFSVEGKNAEERKNALTTAKAGDEVYAERLRVLNEAKAKLTEAEREAQTARHRERYWHAFVAMRAAQVQYLAA